jgi:hypothetical protein
MWKRVPRFNRGKENVGIGNPSLIKTTYDEKALQKLPGVSEAQNTRPPLVRQGTDDTNNSLPPLDL